MRISDWSSDVCSSELQVDRIVEVERRHGLFLLGPVASRLVPALVLRAPPEVAGILAQAELAVDLLPEAGVAQAIDPHRPGRALPRSEERRGGKECGRTCRLWGPPCT